MPRHFIFSLLILTPTLFTSGCSLYESSGRQAIEDNKNGIATISGLSTKLNHYYVCTRSHTLPEFLKEPLEVVETQFETRQISVLLNRQAEPVWLAVYRHNSDSQTHDDCKIYFIGPPRLDSSGLLEATQVGVSELDQLPRL